MTDTGAHADLPAPSDVGLIPTGVLTLVAVAFALAAFDDITTDKATRFPLEYSWLLGSGVWCLIVAVRLAKTGHRVLATVSLLALGSAAWGGRAIGARLPGLQSEYVTTLAGVIWFFVLSVILVALGVRGSRANPISTV